MRVGRPAGGSVVAAPDGTTQERLVPRRVVVGNLGYDVSFTLPARSHCGCRSPLVPLASDCVSDLGPSTPPASDRADRTITALT